MISGIIKVEASVISRGWLHLPRPRLFRISQQPNSIIVLLYIVLWKRYKNYTVLIMLPCSSFLFLVQNAVAEKDPAEEIKVFVFCLNSV